MRSRLVALGLVWGCLGTGVLLACGGGDEGSSSGGTPDASTSSSGGSSGSNTDASNPAAPNIVADNLTIYTGMTAALDGSGTQAQTFAWTVKTVPAGSTVATGTLAGAGTARPSFRADVSGDYVLELTAANGSLSSKKDVTVKAVPAPLFYMQSNFSEKPAYFEYRAIGTDGTGGHPIACRTNGQDPDGGDVGGLLIQSMLLSDMGEDWWEAPSAADPSRVAFVAFDYVDAGIDASPKLAARLALGTNQSTCQNPPVKIEGVAPDGGNAVGVNLLQPRFNRAGTRVAYLEEKDGPWFIVAVGYDGKDRREIAKMCEGPENGCSGKQVIFPTRPQWLNDTTVGWARQQNPDAGTGWEVVTANDSANPNPQVYMTCSGDTPKSIAFLKDGSVIANRMKPDGGAREDLEVLKPNAGTKVCDVVRNLTNLPLNFSYARDFSVAPDESEIAFVRFIQDGGTLPEAGGSRIGGEIYTAPINGATAPVAAGATPQAAQFGPRYVAGATALAFNGILPTDGGAGALEDASAGNLRGIPVISVVQRDGGGVNYAAKSDIDGGSYVSGGGNGGACDFRLVCATGPIQSGGGSTIGLGLAGIALLIRRRRNRRRG